MLNVSGGKEDLTVRECVAESILVSWGVSKPQLKILKVFVTEATIDESAKPVWQKIGRHRSFCRMVSIDTTR